MSVLIKNKTKNIVSSKWNPPCVLLTYHFGGCREKTSDNEWNIFYLTAIIKPRFTLSKM